MRTKTLVSKYIGLYLLFEIVHAATIPNYKAILKESDISRISASEIQHNIPAEQHQLTKRSPAPPYSPGGSNENSFDEIDPRGDRRPDDREEDERSNGPWDMFGNVSPGTLGDLRTHTDLMQNPAPQNMGLGLGLQIPRPALNINAGGGNAPQQTAARQDVEISPEAEEEEKAATEIEEEEKSNTEIEEEEKEASGTEAYNEPEEREDTEIEEEEEKEVTNNLDDYGQESSQHSIPRANSASLSVQSPNYLFPNLQPNLPDPNRRPYLLESPDINSRNSGGRSRSSPTREGRGISGLFGNFDPSTIRDASGNNQLYRPNRNRRQSFSSPVSDFLDFGGNSLLSRFNSGEGPLIRPITLNFGHESAFPQNVQTNQMTDTQDFLRDDLFSQSLDDDFPPPRSLTSLQANQPQRNDQPARGTTLVDITGGLGGPPVYRQQDVKEESDSGSVDSQGS
ncbi:hypothetical protein TWF506_001137 [Arthrobotrys conoides]|uniref:Uncharacterized protein n=1 Tax=Arthrobotrys conoides TaxID=74498 RepID=A0AAN8NX82_9PEZI